MMSLVAPSPLQADAARQEPCMVVKSKSLPSPADWGLKVAFTTTRDNLPHLASSLKYGCVWPQAQSSLMEGWTADATRAGGKCWA